MVAGTKETKLRDLGRPPRIGTRGYQRSIKMMRPLCEVCQDPTILIPRWWEKCKHSPYFSQVKREETTPELSEPDERGRRQIQGEKREVYYEDTPNLIQVQVSPRVWPTTKGETSVTEAVRFRGYKPAVEFGLKPFCEFRDCWSQQIKVRSDSYGNYCSKDQAKLVVLDMTGRTIEVLDEEKRRAMLESINL